MLTPPSPEVFLVAQVVLLEVPNHEKKSSFPDPLFVCIKFSPVANHWSWSSSVMVMEPYQRMLAKIKIVG